MIESPICDNCWARVEPDMTTCPRCGAAIGIAAGPADQPKQAKPEHRESASEMAARAAAAARDAAAKASKRPRQPQPAAEVEAEPGATERAAEAGQPAAEAGQPAAEAGQPAEAAEPEAAEPEETLRPSASHVTLGSIGASRPAGNGQERVASAAGPSAAIAAPRAPEAETEPKPASTAVPQPPRALLAQPDQPPVAAAPVAAAPVAPQASVAVAQAPASTPARAAEPVPAPATPGDFWTKLRTTWNEIAAEPKTELAMTGLTALGAALTVVSFFLPWAADNGIAVGTVDVHPRPGAWGFDTPAGWPLFLLFLLLAGPVLASDVIEQNLPAFAPRIKRLTEVALPMLLGGILLGASLLYLTIPWGCGSGLNVMAMGGVCMVASALVGLFHADKPSET